MDRQLRWWRGLITTGGTDLDQSVGHPGIPGVESAGLRVGRCLLRRSVETVLHNLGFSTSKSSRDIQVSTMQIPLGGQPTSLMSRNRLLCSWGVSTTGQSLQGSKIQTLRFINQVCLRTRSGELGEDLHSIKGQSTRGEPLPQRGQVSKTVSHLHQTTAKQRVDTKPGGQPLGHVGSTISQELLTPIGGKNKITCLGQTSRHLAEHLGQSISGPSLEFLSPTHSLQSTKAV